MSMISTESHGFWEEAAFGLVVVVAESFFNKPENIKCIDFGTISSKKAGVSWDHCLLKHDRGSK